MALARIQASIVKNLLDAGHISDSQYNIIIETDEELSGEAVEKLLIEDYKINHYQLLIAMMLSASECLIGKRETPNNEQRITIFLISTLKT